MDIDNNLIESMQDRIAKINLLLEEEESVLNTQPLENKKTPAEILYHILLVDRAPLLFWRLFYGGLNLFTSLYKKIQDKEIRRNADHWDLQDGNKRDPKKITKNELIDSFEKSQKKLKKKMESVSPRKRNTLKVIERHCWSHLSQIDLLLTKAKAE